MRGVSGRRAAATSALGAWEGRERPWEAPVTWDEKTVQRMVRAHGTHRADVNPVFADEAQFCKISVPALREEDSGNALQT